MPKYIDVDSLRFPNICIFDMTLHGETVPMVSLVDLQKLVPAADVAEVVRCRECIYWEPASPTRTSGNCNRSFDIPAWATDFCSYGKRKDGGQDE